MPDGWKTFLARGSRIRGRSASSNDNGNGEVPTPGNGELPLRAELFSIDQLERHAKTLAGWHRVAGKGGWGGRPVDRLLPRLRENEAVLRQEYRHLAESVKRGRRAMPAGEWFLDNFYLIEEQIRTARKHLPRDYSRELPRLVNGPMAGSPRVYDMALELIAHVDGRVDATCVRAFVAAYESVSSLKLGELWAIPIMLRLALLENLRRAALRMSAVRREGEQAGQWVERMLAMSATDPGKVVMVLAEMARESARLSHAFVAEFASRFHERGASLQFPMTWIEQRLTERGETMEQVLQAASQSQAADQVSVGNSITSLRSLGSIDWRDFVEGMSAVEYRLRGEASGIYPKMDFATRDRYRHAVEEIARRALLPEEEVAAQAVELARADAPEAGKPTATGREGTVGYYLIDRGRRRLEKAVGMRPSAEQWLVRMLSGWPLTIYVASTAGIAGLVTLLVVWWAARHGLGERGLIGLGILAMACGGQLAVGMVQWMATILVTPKLLARMDFSEGIPAEFATVVAVPAMLSDEGEIDDLLESMEIRYLANRDPSLHFALLTDFVDAAEEHLAEDEALLDHARRGIEALNAKYGGDSEEEEAVEGATPPCGAFILFHRPRRWNERDRVWMGWERKRGKLEQFNEFLRGAKMAEMTVVGPAERLSRIKYVITLDSDTQLPRESAWKLIGTMAHPLNQARYDEKRGRVTEGYGILQPRVAIDLPSSGRSRFARFFSGEPGIDPYTRAVSDVYQDVFQEGSYIGKGIYDLDAFRRALKGRLPENRILSHDLLEGSYARAGVVSDVILLEEYPSAYSADVSRRHRWMRGDWQITPWLLPRVPGTDARRVGNPISALSRWKILDNLRRSMVPASMLALLALGWFLPGGAGFYTLVVLALFLIPSVLRGIFDVAHGSEDVPFSVRVGEALRGAGKQATEEVLALAWLPYDAFIGLDAAARALVRAHVTGRRLLEWRTARDAQRTGRTGLWGFYISMWASPAAGAAALAVALRFNPSAFIEAEPFAALWLVSPAIAWFLSQPIRRGELRLPPSERLFLWKLSRRTWRFFEVFVTAEENHLPPDNFQEEPPVGAAHRTSPTNIGLSLLANLAANDFGFIPGGEVLERTKHCLETLDKLQRYKGHFYNWYDTRTLEPLRPMYVSTVDSGNLAGHLLILAAGLEEMRGRPIVPPSLWAGLRATLELAAEARPGKEIDRELAGMLEKMRGDLVAAPQTLSGTHEALRRIASGAAIVAVGAPRIDGEGISWMSALRTQCEQFAAELEQLCPWMEWQAPADAFWRHGDGAGLIKHLEEIPTLEQAARLEAEMRAKIQEASGHGGAGGGEMEALRRALADGSDRAAKRLEVLDQLALRCRELADIDYRFLYDPARRLLSLGYNAVDHRLDPGYYDLLASEARLASFVGIAQGKLPQEHWFSLGRMLTTTGRLPALLSWSGSIFEYLMPLVIMPPGERTLLDETYRAVVQRQIEYGRSRGVPWGISESGYNKTDGEQNYQYKAFGVPGLGLKRGLSDDLVIAPYATVMALMVNPTAACANLRRLQADQRMGEYGFYEAADYTPDHLPPGQTSVTVRSFMVHHQGMSLLSLAYALLDQPMQRRFDAEPAFRSAQLLLHERVPKTSALYPNPLEVSEARSEPVEPQNALRVFNTPHTASPEVQLLSNGRYHVAVTAAGGGYSRWRDLSVTRWHEDAARDCWGTFCFIRDMASGEFWSVGHQPTLKRASSYEVVFTQGRAEFRRRDGDIATSCDVAVSPEDDVEMRRISISNQGRTRRTIEVTSYAEAVMAPAAADAAHPAFSNLFVQTQIMRQRPAILCTRRPRSAADRPPWMLHLMRVQGTAAGEATYETARDAFIGRGRTIADPAAMHRGALSNTEGTVLDPIVSIRQTLILEPDETVHVNLVTGMAETKEAAMGMIEKYHDQHLGERVFELAWTHSQVILRQLDATEADAQVFNRMANNILYCQSTMRAPGSVVGQNRRGQSGLWGYGISGDLPIVLLRIGEPGQIELVRQLVTAHAYWRLKGLAVDLVIWNEDRSGYRAALHEAILGTIASRAESNLMDKPGGIFVRRTDQMSEEDKVLMQTVARIVISDTDGTLAEQMERAPRVRPPAARLAVARGKKAMGVAGVSAVKRDLRAYNGIGGFTPDGREYIITIGADRATPAPWINVLANPEFGTIVSESGSSYTWRENAQMFRLTPWNNDWISDVTGEAMYIRDEETGQFFSPTALPAPGPFSYTTRHGFGYTVFEYSDGELKTEMQTYVAMDAPAKFIVVKIRNTSGRQRRLTLTGFFELVLGDRRETNLAHIVTEADSRGGTLFARNSYNADFGQRVVFLDCSESQRTVTGDRLEFLGRNGRLSNPACMGQSRLSGRIGAGLDPCAAMQASVDLAAGQETEVAFVFGCGRDAADARSLAARFRGVEPARAALGGVWEHWKRTLGAVQVATPDPYVDYLLNGWLLYQTLACRLWGRSGFYQSGGAFGFRDQLQDAAALVHAAPGILREQLVRSANHQFREGDVQHWWHPPSGRGVRTRISDDYLWLPYMVSRYVTATGDRGVLEEKAGFLTGRLVGPEEDSYYDLPATAEETGTVYEHCVRAIKNGLRYGVHGLPLMGTGDWNDGMNTVGEHGKGESVWLGFFLHDVLSQFIPIANMKQDAVFAERCATEAAGLRNRLEEQGWDGEWYRRAFFDDGRPLGSKVNTECRIDSLPQSWSVLSGVGDAEHRRLAMEKVGEHLVNRDLRVIKLFEPALDESDLQPGYVKGYPPGVRENGGQYTHAAIWAVMALAKAGEGERAWEWFNMINPIRHGDSEAAIRRYKVEPYVVAADVYTNLQHAGRGGWTWYTGSAGWMYRLMLESLLGLRLEGEHLRVLPVAPAAWDKFTIHYRHGEAHYHIQVHTHGRGAVKRMTLDGAEVAERVIPLTRERGEHEVVVEMGQSAT
jgi:cyclic beta-1,2-glucan synthetase